MTKFMTQIEAPLRDALYELSLSQAIPNAEALDDLVRRFPHHADEITDFAVALALELLQEKHETHQINVSENKKITSPEVERAMSRFQNHLYQVQQSERLNQMSGGASVGNPYNPFIDLNKDEFRSLAKNLNTTNVFLAKLRDRQIRHSTMSKGFKQCVASKAGIPMDLLSAHFEAPPIFSGQRQFYKSDQKPESMQKQTFLEAVMSSGMTPDQQEYLKNL